MSGISMDLQSSLLECMLSGGGIEAVCRLLAGYFNACVSIRNADDFHASADQKPDKDTFIYIMERDVHAGSHYLGRLTAERSHEPFSDSETHLFEKAAELVALQLQQDKKIADIEFRLRGNFIEDLISAHFTDPDSIKKRAHVIDYEITAPHRVLVAEIENIAHVIKHQNLTLSVTDIRSELAKFVYNRLNQLSKGMVMHRNDEMVILIRIDAENRSMSAVKAISEEIINFVYAQYSAKMYIGIGSVCTELPDFSKSYHAAKKALEIGEYMITEGRVRSLEQFSVHALFLSTVKPADLYNYAREHLGRLLAYDRKNGSELLKTLQEYLYLRNNVEKTARSINLSVSGLKYRLQRIEKIIGLELNDYKVSFDLQLALVIMQLYGEYPIRNDRT